MNNLDVDTPIPIKDAVEYWQSGTGHACCPDHWRDCDNAWVLADTYLKQQVEIKRVLTDLQSLCNDMTGCLQDRMKERILDLQHVVNPFDDEEDEEIDDGMIFDINDPKYKR